MARKIEYLILIVLIVGLGLFLWKDKTDQVHYQLPSLEQVHSGKITKITLRHGNETVGLQKKGDRWILDQGGYPANSGQVQKIVNAVSGLNISAMASKGKHYARYKLDQASAVQVKAWANGDLVRSFSVGKTASTYQNTYVRLPDDPAVYLAQSNLRFAVDQDSASLRDKTVLSFSPQDITQVVLATPEQTVTLNPASTSDVGNTNGTTAGSKTWQDQSGRTVQTDTVNSFVSRLSGLKCVRYLEDKEPKDLNSPGIHITLHGKKDHELKLFPGQIPEDNGTAGTSSDNAFAFALSKYNAKQLTQKFNQLLGKDEQPQPDSGS